MDEGMTEWHRVNRHRPCEICNHTDWCTYCDTGSCCMRMESSRSMRNGGYFHPVSGSSPASPGYISPRSVSPYHVQPQHRNFNELIARWKSEKAGELEPYAALLGVGLQDLIDLDVCWAKEYRAFAYPMHNPDGETVGIRIRNNFHKWSVKGSRQGLFIPFAAAKRFDTSKVMIVEGPTDCAAGLALGFFTIGRPNNLVGNEMIVELLRQLPVKEVIVAYDNDEHVDSMGKRIRPGPFGAERLIKSLRRPVTRFVPPTKDLRSFLTSGGSRALLLSLTACTIRS